MGLRFRSKNSVQRIIEIILHSHSIMNFCLVLRSIKNIFHLPIRHCRIQFLYITEFLDRNRSPICTIWQRNLSLSLFEMMNVSDPDVLACMDNYHVRLIAFSGFLQFAILLTDFPLFHPNFPYCLAHINHLFLFCALILTSGYNFVTSQKICRNKAMLRLW